jgi:hypothetical protein
MALFTLLPGAGALGGELRASRGEMEAADRAHPSRSVKRGGS